MINQLTAYRSVPMIAIMKEIANDATTQYDSKIFDIP